MINVVGVQFQQDGKITYCSVGEFSPKPGDYIIASLSRGLELGEVVIGIHLADEQMNASAVPTIIRIATQQDIQQATDNRAREREAYRVCQRKILEHKLEMKLVSVESTFDNSKMLFYFTANGRVDFRALVKDLASTFKTRIELRQIGVRDEARMLGGLGPCGRPICCGAFLNNFQPVSIKMAKEQNLSLNPTKISGVCGRLMCCLKYEQDQYEQARKRMPKVGREVNTPDGIGCVTDLNVVKETVMVRISSGDSSEIREYSLEMISRSETKTAETDVSVSDAENEGNAETDVSATAGEEFPDTAKEGPRIQPPKANPRKQRKGGNERRQDGNRGRENEAPKSEEDKSQKSKPGKTISGKKNGDLRLKSQKLGKPVRRENPERDRKTREEREKLRNDTASSSGNAEIQIPKNTNTKENGNAPEPVSKASGWADAVNKALQAIDS